jgi:hypothetical protein
MSFQVDWGVPMKLPFAVYTARQGYAWQSGVEHGKGKLERFRRIIGRMPEFDFGDPTSRGFVNAQDCVVAFRFMRQSKADAAGRDAAYLAITFFTSEQARFINADSLFANHPFNEPLQNPPSFFEYQAGPAIPVDFAIPSRSKEGSFSSVPSLSSAGFVFSQHFSGTLRIYLSESPHSKPVFEYAPPASRPMESAASASQRPAPASFADHVPESASAVIHSAFWKAIAIAAIMVAVVQSIVIIWLLWPRSHSEPQAEPNAHIPTAIIPEPLGEPAQVSPYEEHPQTTPASTDATGAPEHEAAQVFESSEGIPHD